MNLGLVAVLPKVLLQVLRLYIPVRVGMRGMI